MKLPRFSLAYLMELVLAMALGIAAARLIAYQPQFVTPDPDADWAEWVIDRHYYIDATLRTVGIVEGAILVALRFLRRIPAAWGVGRWIWCYLLISTMTMWLSGFLSQLKAPIPITGSFPTILLLGPFLRMAGTGTTILISYAAYAVLGGSPQAPTDQREWMGRTYGITLIIWDVVWLVATLTS